MPVANKFRTSLKPAFRSQVAAAHPAASCGVFDKNQGIVSAQMCCKGHKPYAITSFYAGFEGYEGSVNSMKVDYPIFARSEVEE